MAAPEQLTAVTLVVVLIAAAAHATWNALAKIIPDRVVSAGLIGLVYAIVGASAVSFLPLPHGGAWPFIALSSLVQSAYLLMLMGAYRSGELGEIYPITRGLSPVVVTVVSFWLLGERVSLRQIGGITLVCAGLAGLVFVHGMPRRGSGYGLAMLTGVFIAAYTLIDGIGVRRSGDAISYTAWLFALQGPVIPIGAFLVRGRGFVSDLRRHWRLGTVGGVLSLLSYAAIVWAQSRAPLGAVATLRETSVVLAALLGRLIFRERLGAVRVLAAVIVASGIVAIAV